MMNRPFVVSNDIVFLLQAWASSSGFTLPGQEFFAQLRKDLKEQLEGMFSEVEIIEEAVLRNGIVSLLPQDATVLSLDQTYCLQQADYQLNLTRLVRYISGEYVDAGLGKRPNSPALSQQLTLLQAAGVKRVVLVDDVIYSGGVIEDVISLLAKVGIDVTLVVAGIGIHEGIHRVSRLGKTVKAVKTYEQVIDEICERDFYPGMPYSGRTLVGDANIGVPYLLPYGVPTQWASIPEASAIGFSRFCLEQTIALFTQIELVSQREVLCEDLERKLYLHRSGRFVDWLVQDLYSI